MARVDEPQHNLARDLLDLFGQLDNDGVSTDPPEDELDDVDLYLTEEELAGITARIAARKKVKVGLLIDEFIASALAARDATSSSRDLTETSDPFSPQTRDGILQSSSRRGAAPIVLPPLIDEPRGLRVAIHLQIAPVDPSASDDERYQVGIRLSDASGAPLPATVEVRASLDGQVEDIVAEGARRRLVRPLSFQELGRLELEILLPT